MNRRAIAGFLAFLGAFAVSGQFGLIIAAQPRTMAGFVNAIGTFLSYFTLLTNSLVAVTLAAHAAPESKHANRFTGLSWATSLAVYITVVGVVYHFMLRMLWDPQGFQKFVDVVLHYVMPVAFLGFWTTLPRVRLSPKQPVLWLWYPFVYGMATLAAGAATGKYPYPFADVGALGLTKVMINLVAMLSAFLLLGFVFRFLVRPSGSSASAP